MTGIDIKYNKEEGYLEMYFRFDEPPETKTEAIKRAIELIGTVNTLHKVFDI